MNKKNAVIAVVILLLILILGAGWFLSRGVNNKSESKPVVENAVPTQASPQPKSLRELLSLGTSQQCTFTTNQESNISSGTIYISSGKVRGDIESTVENKKTALHMIVDGGTSYMWMDNSDTGFKVSFEPAAVTGTPSASQPGSINPDQPADYNCSTWIADPSLFVLPANIKFSDLGNKCSTCNMLTGDSKIQCLSALGCN